MFRCIINAIKDLGGVWSRLRINIKIKPLKTELFSSIEA